MTTVEIFPLVMPLPAVATFARSFARRVDADDYIAFWRQLGSCHVKEKRDD